MNGSDRVAPKRKHIDAAKTLVEQSRRGEASVKGARFIMVDEDQLVDRVSISLAGCEDMAAGLARIEGHNLLCLMCQKGSLCDVGSSLRMDFTDTISPRSTLAAEGKV